jgi:two-component system sensor kinase FixL
MDAVIGKDLNGIITDWNISACSTFGYEPAEAIGRHISLLIPPDRLAEEDMIISRLKSGLHIDHYETVRLHKNGAELLVSLSVSPIHDTNGRIVGASKIARDITEKKRSEANLQLLQSELAHVARLSAMGQMSAAIAHELNQPLTAIVNYLSAAQRMLTSKDFSPQRLASALEAMEKASAQTLRAGSIIQHLREFVEKREAERGNENLNTVVEEAIALGFVGAADSDVKVNRKLSLTALPVRINRIQVQQVLINLIRNGIEAMSQSPRRVMTLTTGLDGDFAFVEIRDTGPGLPAEVLAKLFQPFVTTKERGMGIGLNICQSIMEAHGGNIQAPTPNEGGAIFRIRLPLYFIPD